jgi:hypothetical protein
MGSSFCSQGGMDLQAYKYYNPQPVVRVLTTLSVVQELFRDIHYADLEGGILEGFGRLLKFDLKVRRL